MLARHASAVLAAAALTSFAAGGVNPFTETFSSGAADWHDSDGSAVVDWSSAGGPDGSPFITTDLSFVGNQSTDNVVLFRAQDEFNSSGNAFVGNWVDAGITSLSFEVRHDGPAPLNYFVRISGPGNFPGAAAIAFVPVQPNTWTTLEFAITASNPAIIYEGGPSNFFSVFGNVGHMQVGVVAGSLAGQSDDVTFDLDNVAIAVPAPGAFALLSLAAVSRRRRRRQRMT